jgi:hypothetical protein
MECRKRSVKANKNMNENDKLFNMLHSRDIFNFEHFTARFLISYGELLQMNSLKLLLKIPVDINLQFPFVNLIESLARMDLQQDVLSLIPPISHRTSIGFVELIRYPLKFFLVHIREKNLFYLCDIPSAVQHKCYKLV